ncbi:MAG: adenylate kinase [Spirochaetales bacterium]|nr:adenylate kinase [Spirochaetales bacterium]
MIILITGASSTGKTCLAQKLLEKYHFPYYSLDHIKMGLYRGEKNCPFSPTDSREKITRCLAPLIEGIIRTALENGQNLIMEGCYFHGESLIPLMGEYPGEIQGVTLFMEESYCLERFRSHVIKHRNSIEQRQYEEERSAEQFLRENRLYAEEAAKSGFKLLSIQDDFEAALNGFDLLEGAKV